MQSTLETSQTELKSSRYSSHLDTCTVSISAVLLSPRTQYALYVVPNSVCITISNVRIFGFATPTEKMRGENSRAFISNLFLQINCAGRSSKRKSRGAFPYKGTAAISAK